MNFRVNAIALAASLATLPAWLQAQTTTDAAPQRIEITGAAPASRLDATATTTSRLGLTLRETPASVTVVDQAAIDAMGASNTQDILTAIPGVSFSSQPGASGSVFYRGFGASSLAQLYNGISVQYDAISARPVDSWLVDRLEAIGGPSSFLNGSGAVGGSINVITKLADLRGDLGHARVALGDTRQLALDLQRTLGTDRPQVLRLTLNGTEGTHWSLGEGRKSWQAAASWRAPLTATLSHTLAVEQQFEQVTQPYWGTPLLKDAAGAIAGQITIDPRTIGVNYNVLDGQYRQKVTWVRAMLHWQPTPATALTHTLYHYDALRDYENVETYAFVAGNSQVERSSALLQRHDQQVWGSRGELSHRTLLAGLKSDFALGWDWSYNRQTRFPLSVAGPFDRIDPYAPAASYFYATPGIVPGSNPGATNQLHTVALFAENRTVLAPGWSLATGLRVDRINLAVRNHRTASASNPALYETAFKPVTGRIGLVRDLSPAWQVYAQLSTAADPPAGVLATAGFSALRDFDLTRGRQVELGSKGSFDGGRGDASVSVYQIVRKNLSMTDPNDRARTVAIGQQSSRGIELNARWRPVEAWQLAGQLSHTDAQYDDFTETAGTTTVSRAGNRPANVPDWVAGATITWRPVAAVQLSADWRHVGRRFANTSNTVWDGAYELLGASAQWQPDVRTTLRLRVANLTDQTYAATVGASNLVYLGAPRTVSLSADWQF